MNKGYFQIMINEFQANLAYKVNLIFRMFSYIIVILIQITIWKALFNGQSEINSQMGTPITLLEMTTYVIISTCISIVISNQVIDIMENKVKTGEISMDLIKPINIKLMFLFNTIGSNAFKILFQLSPLLIVCSVVYKPQLPNIEHFFIFTLTLLNAFIIYFLLTFIVGLLSFWYMAIWHMKRFLNDLISILSGSVIPLWFFPQFLIDLTTFLPFKLIYFLPLSIYLGRLEYMECLMVIIQQCFWIIILLLLGKFIWSKGINKLVIQGG
ncbi:ABC transporter permease [Gracilibacillus halophilus YIM-C55.5]|uniref:ABC transporter permease n=1 Tax=Gracilibacillus halophilus YIM-C55.5 TaxID=1308866 RepID=N4WMA2_9BACI|nr:ABC-2 family transporter protein [Gracilibacillus halophilus]ENH95630.1 ABC transporter permease [Gracilibacillus halophilus YIM-C55.5]